MKHAILGPGAIGGLLATALSSLGEDVTLVVRPNLAAEYPRELKLDRPTGELTAHVKVAGKVSESYDVLWIATKTYQLDEALQSVEVISHIVVPLLNGVDHVAVLRQRFGHDRVVPATIAVEAERSVPGRFIHRTPVRLSIAARGEPVLKGAVAGLQGLGFVCRFIANEATLLWSKLCVLGPFALVTSASGKNNGEIMADAEWKTKLESALHEAQKVATAERAEIELDKLVAVFAAWPPTVRASMAKDLAAGRPLELDGIAGPILRGGKSHGIATPVTSELVGMIEAKERTRVM